MSPQDALKLLDNTVAGLPLSRQQHALILQAIEILANQIKK